jgi:hypothetical protein
MMDVPAISADSRRLDNVPIDTTLVSPAPPQDFRLEDVVCHRSLGGLLKHYERRVA